MKTMLSNLKRLLGKRSKGFTLIEMVISVALLGILVTGVVMFMSPVMDMIQSNKKNARATMLAETINSYVMGNLSKAKIVYIFAGQNVDSIIKDGPLTFDSYAGNITTLFGPGKYADENEVRCMGMVWMKDNSPTGANRKKLMLVNCKVDSKTLKIDKKADVVQVFDDALYSDLYPTIHLDIVKNASGDIVNSYEVTTNVYVTPKCYNTIQELRDINPVYKSTSYVNCPGLSGAYTRKGQLYPTTISGALTEEEDKIQASIDTWYDVDNGFTDGTNNYFYTDTLIYYVVEK